MCSFIPEEELASLPLRLEATELSPFGHDTTQADCHTIFAVADFTLKLSHRYKKVVCDLIQQMDQFYAKVNPACESYDFQPVLVAESVDESVDESVYYRVPRCMGLYYVEMSVLSGKWYITDLSLCTPRSFGVGELTAQALMRCKTSGFQTFQRRAVAHQHHSSAPDVSITARPGHIPPGLPPFSRAAVAELEVSNRSVARMRKDFVRYFDEPMVCSVVVIKMFPDNLNSPCQSAVAVQWTRQPGESAIAVTIVCDFGILPISPLSAALFESEWPLEGSGSLPPVPRELWAANRFAPVSTTDMPSLPASVRPGNSTKAVEEYVHNLLPTQCTTALYKSGAPTLRVNGELLRTFLHNLPPAWPVKTDDFVLDLGSLFYTMQTCSMSRLDDSPVL